jgi:hypothetical protein
MANENCISNCTRVSPDLPACYSQALVIGYVNKPNGTDVIVYIEKSNGSHRLVETTTVSTAVILTSPDTQITDANEWLNSTAGFYRLYIRDLQNVNLDIYNDAGLTSEAATCLTFCVEDREESSKAAGIAFTW